MFPFRNSFMKKRISTSKELDLLVLLSEFIAACKQGRQLQKNGKPLSIGSIKKYEFLHLYLSECAALKNIKLSIIPAQKLTERQLITQKNYWKRLYKYLTDYLYNERDCYDNFVGRTIKSMRTFLNYLNDEKNIQTAPYKKYFYVRTEEISIVVLSPERLHFLIYNQDFENELPDRLKKVKDIMVMGCTVALRYSDLMQITSNNIHCEGNNMYLNVKSQKTATYTRVKLPDYVLDILKKYPKKQKTLLPKLSKTNLNKYMKEIASLAQWTEPFIKTREKRGKPTPIYADVKTKSHYRFCDMVSSHTMRRTAITTMLLMGMNEMMVRSISGHAANSKEFFKYVALVQQYLDCETDKFHENLKALPRQKTLAQYAL